MQHHNVITIVTGYFVYGSVHNNAAAVFWREVWVGRTSWGAAAVGMDAANSQLGCPAVKLELPAGLGRNKRKRSRCGTSLSAQLSEQIDVSSIFAPGFSISPEHSVSLQPPPQPSALSEASGSAAALRPQ